MNNQWVWVDTPSKRDEAREDISRSSIICVDTEYDSYRYFRAMLCLIQIEANERTWLFDPFCGLDYSFLGKIFSDPNILKIMHAGDNDVRILRRDYSFTFHNIFDTHRAASILGCRYLSLSALISCYLRVAFEKNKSMQRSRWDTRPLNSDQLRYAVDDTAYLKDLYLALNEELRNNGLQEAASKVFECISEVKWDENNNGDARGFRNLKGYHFLTTQQKSHLKTLYHWRLKMAQDTNLALFRILPDHAMMVLARMEKPSLGRLTESGLLSSEKTKLYGSDIIHILNHDDKA
jgi:ribonuclease D